jgi:hypothetical protein
MGRSVRTIEIHRGRVMKKLEIQGTAQIAVLAWRVRESLADSLQARLTQGFIEGEIADRASMVVRGEL